ncbi:zinc metalloprotease HtpX [bacterium]|nr:zinc metalloprotease HtpX [bacterium]MDG2446110.1 zinc metalloprotease HtpX [Thermodesulfobacteriota bacterium]|tara:strand:- start:8467 stop:9315 length:849 start_codon:yes stop_codon:yes gene_type:complete
MNSVKTFFLLSIMTSFFLLIGQYIGGAGGMQIAFIFAVVMNIGSYWYSDKIILKIYKAKEADSKKFPEILKIFENLCNKANLPKPKLFIYESEEPNAFATGRNKDNAVVALSSGIINLLSIDEIEGVLAHELAHIENNDILIASVAATFAGAISMIASMLKWGLIFGAFRGNRNSGNFLGTILVAIIAPIIALIIQMAISRTREFKADNTAAQITKKPNFLSDALVKIQDYHSRSKVNKEVNTATSHMFIISPISGGVGKWFSSHPPTEERVKKLRELEFVD